MARKPRSEELFHRIEVNVKIVVNGENREIAENLSLESLLGELALPEQRIAIELNQSVVRKKDWGTTLVSEGDRVEIVHFVGGG
jgi:thiamine biosynthesis protein ThiS